MPVKQYRNFCFTEFTNLFSPINWDSGTLLRKTFRYVGFGLEHTEDGNPHLQAFCASWKKISLKAANEAIHSQFLGAAEIAPMKDSICVSEAYCSKEGRLQEFGVIPNAPGIKNCLVEFKHQLDEGIRPVEVAEDDKMFGTFCQYRKGLEDYAAHIRMKRIKYDMSAPEVFYLWGPPESGKSRYAFANDKDLYRVAVDNQYKWKDGYYGQEAVLYDNVTPHNISPSRLLQEIDRYPMQCAVKGGFTAWKPKRIYITSVHPIEQFAAEAKFSVPREFTRRVTTIKAFPLDLENAQAEVRSAEAAVESPRADEEENVDEE